MAVFSCIPADIDSVGGERPVLSAGRCPSRSVSAQGALDVEEHDAQRPARVPPVIGLVGPFGEVVEKDHLCDGQRCAVLAGP